MTDAVFLQLINFINVKDISADAAKQKTAPGVCQSSEVSRLLSKNKTLH